MFITDKLVVLDYKNRDTAQYTSKSAMAALVVFAYFENSNLKTEPNTDQQSVKTKPMKASSRENANRAKGSLL